MQKLLIVIVIQLCLFCAACGSSNTTTESLGAPNVFTNAKGESISIATNSTQAVVKYETETLNLQKHDKVFTDANYSLLLQGDSVQLSNNGIVVFSAHQ
jgi:hypothetical protein